MSLSVTQAVAKRRSIRAFLDTPVERKLITDVLAKAQRAPSGGNLQPWHAKVLTGAPLEDLKAKVAQKLPLGAEGQSPEYNIYPKGLSEPYRSRRFGVGEALYDAIGIGREDKMGRMMQMAQNFRAFDAPICMFIHTHTSMGPPQWSDLGMWLQTIMLLLAEAGLDSCAQEAWSIYGQQVREVIAIPDDHIFFCGMAIGYGDYDAAINQFAVPRDDWGNSVDMLGFE